MSEPEIASAEQAYGMLLSLMSFPDDKRKHQLTIEQADEMERRDDMVRAALALKRAARLATGYRIQAASKKRDHVEQAEFCKYVLEERLEGSLSTVLNQTMFAFGRGFSIQEKVWEDRPYSSGPWAGKIGIARIKQKPTAHFFFKSDRFGNLLEDGLWQEKPLEGGGGPIAMQYDRLPVKKFFIYTHDMIDDDHYGRSDLRAAWRPYELKNNIYPAWRDFMIRFGAPLLVAMLKGGTELTGDQRSKVMTFLEKLRRGTVALLPEGVKIEDLVAKLAQTHTSTYDEAMRSCDRAIARAVLLPSLILSEGERGSQALGESHVGTLWSVLDYEGVVLCDGFNESVIRDLIDMNFPEPDAYPYIAFDPFADRDLKPAAEVLEKLVNAGYAPKEEWVFERFGIPIEESEDEEVGPEVGKREPPAGKRRPGAPVEPQEPDEDQEPPDTFAGAVGRYWRDPVPIEGKVDFAAAEIIEDRELAITAAAIVGVVAASREEVVRLMGKAHPPRRPPSSGSGFRPPSSET